MPKTTSPNGYQYPTNYTLDQLRQFGTISGEGGTPGAGPVPSREPSTSGPGAGPHPVSPNPSAGAAGWHSDVFSPNASRGAAAAKGVMVSPNPGAGSAAAHSKMVSPDPGSGGAVGWHATMQSPNPDAIGPGAPTDAFGGRSNLPQPTQHAPTLDDVLGPAATRALGRKAASEVRSERPAPATTPVIALQQAAKAQGLTVNPTAIGAGAAGLISGTLDVLATKPDGTGAVRITFPLANYFIGSDTGLNTAALKATGLPLDDAQKMSRGWGWVQHFQNATLVSDGQDARFVPGYWQDGQR